MVRLEEPAAPWKLLGNLRRGQELREMVSEQDSQKRREKEGETGDEVALTGRGIGGRDNFGHVGLISRMSCTSCELGP
jgi:hypothetical protein